jgi:hypothetical protein
MTSGKTPLKYSTFPAYRTTRRKINASPKSASSKPPPCSVFPPAGRGGFNGTSKRGVEGNLARRISEVGLRFCQCPERMIWNPGQLPPDWTLEKWLGKHASQPFNPDVANALERKQPDGTCRAGHNRELLRRPLNVGFICGCYIRRFAAQLSTSEKT